MADNIDGIPFLFDEEYENQLFGQLFPNGLSQPEFNSRIQSPASPLSPTEINSPFGAESIFYVISDLQDEIETDDEKKYTYKVNFVKSGTEVFSKYKTAKPTDKQLLIFYEEESKETSNFFGTACRVKMGKERKKLMKSLINRKRRVSVNGDSFEATNLEQWAKRVTQHNKKIDYQVLLSAVKLELLGKSDDDSFFKSLLGLNNKLADWLYSGVDAMEKWKFTDVNYEYGKYYLNAEKKTFQPIIPISFFEISNQYEYLTTGKKDKKTIVNNGLKQLTELANSFDTVLFNASANIVLTTPTITDDILFATIYWLKNYLEKNLPETIKTIFKKIKTVVKQVEKFIHQLGKQIENNLALFNAFLCGLANGIISLFQTIVGLLAFVIDNIPILELENLSKEKIFAQQEKLEFIEDLVDTVSNNISELFNGLIKTIKTFPSELAKFAKAIGKKIKGLSQYFWVFIIGAVAFELILDAIIAFFTGGTSLDVEVATFLPTCFAVLIKFLKKEIDELINALKDGKFLEYLKEKVLLLFDDKFIDDILDILPENTLSASASRIKLRKINSLLKKSKAVFNPKKPALKKLGIKLVKSKNGLSVDFSKTPKYLFGGRKSSKSIVKIKLKGRRKLDFDTAWKKAGFNDKQREILGKKYMWHHLDDLDPVKGEATMQLVERFIHKNTTPHIGSVKQIEAFFNIKYK